MKKRGFTLAEVLIALGVVGVIAAITTPMLMTATAKSQVETGLAKSVAIWEQANIGALKDADSSNILDAWGKSDGTLNYEEYSKALSNQMKMSSKLIEENQETSFVNKLLPAKEDRGHRIAAFFSRASMEYYLNVMYSYLYVLDYDKHIKETTE